MRRSMSTKTYQETFTTHDADRLYNSLNVTIDVNSMNINNVSLAKPAEIYVDYNSARDC